MLKKYVLKKNHQFQDIIGKKKQVVTRSVVIYHLNNEFNHIRLGISISKKFANAVMRNKYRRQTRNILDKLNLWDKFSKDIVLILRKPFLEMDNLNKTKALKKAFERLENG